ncbi:MAG: helix-hairpin-helix domain-containing protein [Lachnospiraceae bacterium]|nr:helix-hairpin-helix domain-containing protein [Lachnospiraceae bacterium]
MKKRIKFYGGMGLICLFLFGCAFTGCGKKQILVDADGAITEDLEAETEEVGAGEERIAGWSAGEELTDSADMSTEGRGKNAVSGENVLTGQSETVSIEDGVPTVADSIEDASLDKEAEGLWVHICGEVILPGVYELPSGSRIYDAIQAAGGISEKGDGDYLNQASLLSDGMKITVPSFTEVKEWEARGESGIQTGASDEAAGTSQSVPGGADEAAEGGSGATQADERIDINTADEAALCTLPGIGSSRAKSIIAYREEKGPFSRIEDIMNVSGIKEAAFAKIKEYIRVS